ncbi:family 20 glycosylhydrolase [Bacteroides sp.]|uniref:glycoside hydrolase family 20 protein n=1 Tax=Bacteroides sp. TaxID=29523 RepID=UPI003A904FF1
MRQKYRFGLLAVGLAFLMQACSRQIPDGLQVPLPVYVEEGTEEPFVIDGQTVLAYPSEEGWMQNVFPEISRMEKYIGWKLKRTLSVGNVPEKNTILFRYNPALRKEGFRLKVHTDSVVVEVKDAAGAFYSAQWLTHTLMLQGRSSFMLPVMRMEDYPEMSYRGAMLDVSRHFFTVEQVKRFIDLLAAHRLNYFHWHLTDDQGWRIEIKKYPKLTEVGAWRGEGADRYGGFYTQEEIREVVSYAAERVITVVPEIDLPGHTTAALAAYPQLGCTGGPYAVAMESGGVHKDVMCMGKEFSYQFAREVLAEVATLFPSPYIHIGGDEVPRDRWESCRYCQDAIRRQGLRGDDSHSAEDMLQGKFNVQMADCLRKLGKKMVGWDEVLSEHIDPETVIMSWRGLGRGMKALGGGHPVIFSSNGHFYLNNYQAGDMENEPKATGGLVMMQKLYEAELIPSDTVDKDLVLGAEACLWSSYVTDNRTLDYMLLPRLAAFSEVVWSGGRRKNYADFLKRLPAMLKLYERLGYTYAPHFFEIKSDYRQDAERKRLEILLESLENAEIYYTLDGSLPTERSEKYVTPLYVSKSSVLRAVAYLPSGLRSDLLEKEIKVNKATFAEIELLSAPAERYAGDGGAVLVDGVRSAAFHTTGMWTGYYAHPLEAVIDLGSDRAVQRVCISSLTDMSSYIMGIKEMEVAVSTDGKKFRQVATRAFEAPVARMEGKRQDLLVLDFEQVQVRYIRVTARGFGALPPGHSGAGETPFLFVDEIEVY